MNTTCPKCGLENAFLEMADEMSNHYLCPDCDYQWLEVDEKSDEEE